MSLDSLIALFDRMPADPVTGSAEPGMTEKERETVDKIVKVFSDDLPSVFPAWESRKQQVDMAKTIALAFERGKSVLAEAGTGTGKSLAILANAVSIAKKERMPIIVSTGTHVLQAQYVEKDVPTLKKAIGDFRVALAKGKSNYLCLKRLDDHAQTLVPAPAIQGISDWSESTQTGDRADLPAHLMSAWQAVNVDDSCIKAACPMFDQCFYYSARAKLDNAQVIIVNHALLMADIVVRWNSFGNASLLPEPAAIIIDEAHHLESVARQSLGTSIAQTRLERILSDVAKGAPNIDPVQIDALSRANISMFQQVAVDINGERTELDPSPAVRQLASEIETHIKTINGALEAAKRRAATEEQEYSASNLIDRLAQYQNDLDDILSPGDGYAVWADPVRRDGELRVTLHSTPVEPANTLRHEVFERVPVICSSATLTTNKEFGYYRSQVGAPEDSMEFIADTPFDYEKNSLLYIPRNLPDPRSDTFHAGITNEVHSVLQATGGRAFVLCTSWRGMNELYEQIAPRIGFRCMRQGDMPHGQLIEEFKQNKSSVLFATVSFWEGVDVQGDALSCVIVDKLPFAVPTDPVTRAKVRAIEARGGNAFMDYSLPEAVLRMRQGFGRLIRSQTDRGVVAIMDRRIIESRYGRIFLNSLPQAKMVRDQIHVRKFFEEVAA